MSLMNAVDKIPDPVRIVDGDFLMPVESSMTISGRGTVVTGRVERGRVKVGDDLEVVGIRPPVKTTCTGVEMFKKMLESVRPGPPSRSIACAATD